MKDYRKVIPSSSYFHNLSCTKEETIVLVRGLYHPGYGFLLIVTTICCSNDISLNDISLYESEMVPLNYHEIMDLETKK